MAKSKKIFVCNNCGNTSVKWEGKCAYCNEWNTFVEKEIKEETKQDKRKKVWKKEDDRFTKTPKRISEITIGKTVRIVSTDSELNRVLGGGIVPGSLILIGGQPGIGKSTLLLQTALRMEKKVLYVTGEESEEQIKMRANRLEDNQNNAFIYVENNLDSILKQCSELKPDLIIVDSIQVIYSPHIDSTPGSVSQVRECTTDILKFAKETNIPVFIVGHITKEGSIAGPKVLEHIVDVVVQFEGDRNYNFRILRTLKNRYGSTEELGIYEMTSTGLRPVENPSELLLSQNDESFSGSSVAATIEGLRPMLIETQALVSTAIYGTPQRSATGFDLRRLNMILAILEKRAGLFFGQKDVFLNIAGGLRVIDPAIDLSIIVSLVSSLNDVAIPKSTCFAGEISLTGEIRAVKNIESRIKEAARLGFEKIFISENNTKGLNTDIFNIKIQSLKKIDELVDML